MFGRDCLLPFDLEFNSFLGLDWTNVQNREDLLKMRLTQLQYFYEESQDARDKIFKSRLKGKFYHDAKKKKTPVKLQENDLVLVFEEIFETQTHGRKFVERYRGPYKIVKDLNNGAYYLAELDGSRLKGSYHGNRLRKFYCRMVEDNQNRRGEDVTGLTNMLSKCVINDEEEHIFIEGNYEKKMSKSSKSITRVGSVNQIIIS